MKNYIFCVLLLASSFLAGQNLVPNSSFEIIKVCPWDQGQIDSAAPWFRPTTGTPDLFNVCATFDWMQVPVNELGSQLAHTGNGYAGFLAKLNQIKNGREYLEVKLLSPLTAGKKYCVSYFLSLGDSSTFGIGSIGIYFSKDTIQKSNDAPLQVTPQIVNPDSNFIIDKINWVEISGEYTAVGGEQFITIGNFKKDSLTPVKIIGGTQDDAYYYIDDIAVYDCLSGDGINQLNNNLNFEVYPNPAIDKLTLSLSTQNSNYFFTLYDILGNIVYQIRFAERKQEINVSGFSKGVYFVELMDEKSGAIGRKKIIVE